MAQDSEYLCLSCGAQEASHEYCDDCLETLQGDWVVIGGPDWVVHVTEEQEQYGYLADAIDQMIQHGRDQVRVLSGTKALGAPPACEPKQLGLSSVADDRGWLAAGDKVSPLDLGDLSEDLKAALERYEEAYVLTEAGKDAADECTLLALTAARGGPRSRPSALAAG